MGPADVVDLSCEVDAMSVSLYGAVRLAGFDVHHRYNLDIWKLSGSTDKRLFVPRHVRAVRITPIIQVKWWRPRPRHAPLPVVPLPPGEKPPHPFGKPVFPKKPPAIIVDTEGDEIKGPLARALAAWKELDGSDVWDPPDDSGSEEGGGGVPPLPGAPAPPVPAPGGPAPLPDAPVPGGGGGGGGHGDGVGGPWDAVKIPGVGKFVLDVTGTNPAIGCHCAAHGCRFNRVVSKMPVGACMAWLEDQWNPNHHGSGVEHMKARLDRSADGPLSHPKRQSGRDRAKAMALMKRVLEWEGAPPDFEEPVILAR